MVRTPVVAPIDFQSSTEVQHGLDVMQMDRSIFPYSGYPDYSVPPTQAPASEQSSSKLSAAKVTPPAVTKRPSAFKSSSVKWARSPGGSDIESTGAVRSLPCAVLRTCAAYMP